jgi:hypothetical protein
MFNATLGHFYSFAFESDNEKHQFSFIRKDQFLPDEEHEIFEKTNAKATFLLINFYEPLKVLFDEFSSANFKRTKKDLIFLENILLLFKKLTKVNKLLNFELKDVDVFSLLSEHDNTKINNDLIHYAINHICEMEIIIEDVFPTFFYKNENSVLKTKLGNYIGTHNIMPS